MYRKTDNTLRGTKEIDFLAEVDPERLRLIGAITLQWNWIDLAIDTLVAVALRVDGEMWVEVSSRINGFDGKIAIMKAALQSTNVPDRLQAMVFKGLSACEQYKTVRDHIIHMRLASPDEEVSETFHRRGAVKEVFASAAALRQFYEALQANWAEINSIGHIYLALAKLLRLKPRGKTRERVIEALKSSTAQLLESQQKRESLPPLPEVPETAPSPATPPKRAARKARSG